ncbi:hypothetical protein TruAng_009325 [Truncatella angustata]|nr:hypothetical protein TruAng_009325 [Truncatella angustata]
MSGELPNSWTTTGMLLPTSIVALLTGYLLGMYTVQGYLIPPSLSEERRRNLSDPVESDESDVDVDDTILDHAPNWVNSTEADSRDGLKQRKPNKATARSEGKLVDVDSSSTPPANLGSPNEECKLVLVVRTDLGMTKGNHHPRLPLHNKNKEKKKSLVCKQYTDVHWFQTGKIAAQASHATLACYKTLSRKSPTSPEGQLLKRWERNGQAKIAVQVKSQQELLDLMGKARSLGLTAEVIQDAGRTQIEAGSMTVLGVGPAPKSLIDQVTGGLKLL